MEPPEHLPEVAVVPAEAEEDHALFFYRIIEGECVCACEMGCGEERGGGGVQLIAWCTDYSCKKMIKGEARQGEGKGRARTPANGKGHGKARARQGQGQGTRTYLGG